jgi:hypothetical protein
MNAQYKLRARHASLRSIGGLSDQVEEKEGLNQTRFEPALAVE